MVRRLRANARRLHRVSSAAFVGTMSFMGDRVTSLRYRFDNGNEHDHYENARPRSQVMGDFDVELQDGELTATPRREFAQVRDARDALDPLLRAWEISAAIGGHDVTFIFEAGGVEGVNADGSKAIRAEMTETVRIGMDAVIARYNSEYPEPDLNLRGGPVVDQMLSRLRASRSDDRMLVMNANWMVTLIEDEYGHSRGGSETRKTAARELNVDPSILGNVGRLAVRNDPALGRKAKGDVEPLTAPELAWLRDAMAALVRQVARHNSGAHLTNPLSMSDLVPFP